VTAEIYICIFDSYDKGLWFFGAEFCIASHDTSTQLSERNKRLSVYVPRCNITVTQAERPFPMIQCHTCQVGRRAEYAKPYRSLDIVNQICLASDHRRRYGSDTAPCACSLKCDTARSFRLVGRGFHMARQERATALTAKVSSPGYGIANTELLGSSPLISFTLPPRERIYAYHTHANLQSCPTFFLPLLTAPISIVLASPQTSRIFPLVY
jgi:hypothetical protein